MKKKIVSIALLAALVFLLLPGGPAAAEEKLSFISINETLPPELINSIVTYGGLTYVPYHTFSNYGLGVSYTYFSSASTAYLYTREKQLFFELTTGRTYDGDDNLYAGSAILRSGVVYLPLGLMCRFFDHISYSYITGNEYGSILRLTTDAVVLSDAEFLQAARTLMRSYYVRYNSQIETATPATPVPTVAPTPAPAPTPMPTPVLTAPPAATPAPTQTPEPPAAWTPGPQETAPPPPQETEEELTHEGELLTLSFTGAPTAETLDALGRYGLKTCFFLTAEDIEAAPDLLRRALGEGHALGVLSDGDADAFAEAAALLFEASRAATILIAPEDASFAAECEALAAAEGLVCAESEYAGAPELRAVGAWLERAYPARANPRTYPSLRLEGGGGDLVQVLNYLTAQKYDIVCPRETD